jgi:site-specific recombinase XerD
MLDQLQLGNFSEHTIRYYIQTVEDFARHFNRPPDSVAVRLAALSFSYIKTLKKSWSVADTPYPKKAHHLPTILSREEVAQLLQATNRELSESLAEEAYVFAGEIASALLSKSDSTRRLGIRFAVFHLTRVLRTAIG